MTGLDFPTRSNSPKVTKKSLHWARDLTVVSMATGHIDSSVAGSTEWRLSLKSGTPCQNHTYLNELEENWVTGLVNEFLIFSTFQFYSPVQ